MRVIKKLTPALLKKIIAEEKAKLQKQALVESKKRKKKKLKITKEQLLELALIHKRQKRAAAKFKKLFEQKQRLKKQLKG